MSPFETPSGNSPCNCSCHKMVVTLTCCGCLIAGKSQCDCGQHPRCCGDPVPANHPNWPPAPGWRPGDRPLVDPLAGANNDEDLTKLFNQAVIDLTMSLDGNVRGPKFGSRKDEYLPYLVIRAFGGDHGARAISLPWWESPDIFIAPNLAADSAPPAPTTRAGLAQAGAPNTLWTHVWNLGRAPVYNARVEFYWCDPTVGISSDPSNLIGVAHVDLGDRDSGHAHTLVKCPTSWVPTFLNGGHECLIVRCFEPLTDPLGPDPWAAWDDRHVGQRNIHVVDAASPGVAQISLRLGCAAAPGPATLEVHRARVAEVGWLSVLSGRRDPGLRDAASVKEVVGLMYPTMVRGPGDRPDLTHFTPEAARGILRQRIQFERGCDELEAIFYVSVDGLNKGECRIYRIQQVVAGRITGGYTVIVRKH
jgi:hypothetical protein